MENKKYLKDMNKNELKKVFDENDNLKIQVIEGLQETESDYLKEILDSLEVSDYSVSLYSYSYITFSDCLKFWESVKAVNGEFCILEMTPPKTEEEYEKEYNEILEIEDEYSEEYSKKYDDFEKEMRHLAKFICSKMITLLDISDDYAWEEFMYLLEDAEMYSDYYIKNDDFSVMYELRECSL